MSDEAKAGIAWLGSQTGFINEPQSNLTYYHNQRIDPRKCGLNFNGSPYLCIPVDGEGGAREFLGTVETIASERNNRGLLEYVEKLQALLPEEAPDD